jgi:hypothetical protein
LAKNGIFLANQCYDAIYAKLSNALSQNATLFAICFGENTVCPNSIVSAWEYMGREIESGGSFLDIRLLDLLMKKFLQTHPPITKAIRFFTLYLHNMFQP